MAEAAFSASASELKLDMKLPKIEQLNGSGLSAALKNLRKLKSLAKPKLLKALYLAAQHDGKIEAEEVELVRAIAESIDCPMPPMLSA
jgi:tellurite resistance protein